ncbi:relaxase domain-containing protein [Dactylosporangium sp. NPDC049742]|uniref:relaxase domain-containing protein n=1 Tax=Dactylosporangium sp. NPDC049742 TaxID=3154737 RepID=UPI0034236BDD
MIEDQVTAGAFAGRLLDDDLSPRAFGEGPPASAWAGAGDALRQLGLGPGAEVRVRDLVAVLEGRHARTSARVLREPVFYDLVFMAPRSVSVAWSLLGADGRAGIEQAVRASGHTLLTHLTRTAPLAGGARVPRSFVAALVLHAVGTRSSVPGASPGAGTGAGPGAVPPVLHVHGCLFAVQDGDGSLTAPHEPTLAGEDLQRECDAVAGADLAHRLSVLGYQVRNTALAGTGHAFELDGVPAALIDDEAYWSNTGCAAGAS